MRLKNLATLVLFSITFGANAADRLPLDKIKLPAGFEISIYASGLDSAREMAMSPSGTLFVGTRGSKVYAVTPDRKVMTIATGLNAPNGVALKDGSLYVAEISRVLRYDRIEENLAHPPAPAVVSDSFPKDTHHGWKYIAFGPDGWLYIPVGAPCNVCERPDPYASLMRISPDGKKTETVARGIRNTVGFDWAPTDHQLWFTDNGRDMLGDDLPPDELNQVTATGGDYGFPYCYGNRKPDPDFGAKKSCSTTLAPAIELGPHVASLGMRFYTGKQFPNDYRGQIFIAEHGSWNRSVPIGYRISLVKVESGKAVSYGTFAEGWLQGESPWGRPVDVLVARDGSLLVSDDFAGVVYRIAYKG